jgi:heme oxygenase
LRDATRELHVTLDAASPLTSPGFGKADYLAYAARVAGWMRPVEHQLYGTGLHWPADLVVAARGQKSAWLAEDLSDTATSLDCPLDCPYVPQPYSLAAAYGLAYVCEGATLGGAYLYKRLSPQLAPMPLCWLRGYGPDTGMMWKGFLAHLSQDVTAPADIEAAAASARDGFVTFERWMREGR